jgi:hypothetical protein
MKTDRHGKHVALVLGAVAVLVSGSVALGERPMVRNTAAVAHTAEVLSIERASNGKLLAVGRLDRLSATNFAASVLGQDFVLVAGAANNRFVQIAEVGRAVALFGEYVEGMYLVDAAIVLDGQYVQGVSKVYLQGRVASLNRAIGKVSVGALELDASSLMFEPLTASLASGSAAGFVGTQPSIGGKILVEQVVRVRGGRVSDLDASVGTGSPDASVGTGRPDASVGTGSPDASVGTGSPEASVGTGSPEASVGTGSPEASVGTGSPEASVGTGSPEASVGTGHSSG